MIQKLSVGNVVELGILKKFVPTKLPKEGQFYAQNVVKKDIVGQIVQKCLVAEVDFHRMWGGVILMVHLHLRMDDLCILFMVLLLHFVVDIFLHILDLTLVVHPMRIEMLAILVGRQDTT